MSKPAYPFSIFPGPPNFPPTIASAFYCWPRLRDGKECLGQMGIFFFPLYAFSFSPNFPFLFVSSFPSPSCTWGRGLCASFRFFLATQHFCAGSFPSISSPLPPSPLVVLIYVFDGPTPAQFHAFFLGPLPVHLLWRLPPLTPPLFDWRFFSVF